MAPDSQKPTTVSPAPSSEAALGYRNLIAFNRAQTRWSTRGAHEESDGVVLCAGGSWLPPVGNSAFRTDRTVAATELVSRADAFFGSLGRGFAVKVRDSGEDDDLRLACEAAGIEQFGGLVPEMIRRAPLPAPPRAEGVTLHTVEDEAGVGMFIDVNAVAYGTYGMPAEVLADLFDRPGALLDDPAVHVVIATRGPEPVAAAMTFLSDGVASVQWVGTTPAARGAGLGALVTTWGTNLAFDHGASSCTLQASPMGEPLYRRLGYETMYRYAEFVRWQTAPGR